MVMSLAPCDRQAILSDSQTPVKVDLKMSKADQVILKVCLGPLAILRLEEEHEEVSGRLICMMCMSLEDSG